MFVHFVIPSEAGNPALGTKDSRDSSPSPSGDGFLRSDPSADRLDGFFSTLLKRGGAGHDS